MTLAATVAEAARRFGERNAYVPESGDPLTYAALDRLSDEVGAGLAARGVAAGDVVALIMAPGLDYLVSYCGAAKIGAITAGVNDRLGPLERAAVLARADPALVIAQTGLEPEGHECVSIEPAQTSKMLGALRDSRRELPALAPDPDRPVAIVFTSGTTGTPKGALYCERQLEFITATDVGDAWGSGGRGYTGTSFAHLGFMTKLPGNLRRGGTNFILRRWSASSALELVARERLASIAGVPTQLALMLRHPDFDSFDLSSVAALVTGGGPVTPGLVEEARRRFDAPLATRYSCTEAGIGLGTALDDPPQDASISVGRPHPAVDLALLDDSGRAAPPGEVGEVCLRSPAVMSGYWNDPDATAAAFTPSGHVRTGDLGWLDDAGRLRLVGRSKEMYVRGGYNVFPVEVEAVLSAHPAVAAVAIAPRSDDVMGEIGVAIVVASDPANPPTLRDLRDFASASLAKHKLPEALQIIDALPLTAGEKVDRRALAVGVAEPIRRSVT